MRSRFSLTLVVVLLLALLAVVPAAAGGWAVITLDSLPENPTAGQPLEIGFMVRQHGFHPMDGLQPIVRLRNPATGERITLTADPDPDKAGHYQAVLNFPSEGTWEWSIEAYSGVQRMPALQVATANASAEGAGLSAAGPAPLAWGLLALTGLAAGLLLLRSGKTRLALGSGALGLAFAAAALVAVLGSPARAEASPVEVSSVETGRRLFLAKGCVMCHSHNRAESNEWNVNIGPGLSNYSNSEEFLHSWLKDPSAVRENAAMPQLELKEQEILDLIAFINAREE